MTARAVAPLDRLAGWCLPLVGPGGSLLALKGDRADDELAAAGPCLRRLGATELVGRGARRRRSVDPPVRIVRVVAGGRSARSSTTVTVAWCPTAPTA